MVDLQKVVDAARAGGEVIKQLFGQALEVSEKTNLGDLRTKADTDSENAILKVLTQAYPTTNIYAEESGQVDRQSEYTFVIDPLDGTSNFVLGVPDFAVSIGLLHNDESILGVIYNPVLDQLYTAEKGRGAQLNGKTIRVNTESDIARATVSYTSGYNTARAYNDGVVKKLHDLGIKRLLSHWAPAYDYCLLASGRIEAVISKEGDLEDYVAAKIIVTEAGGKITDFTGQPSESKSPDFIASNGSSLHETIQANLF
ncbi:MAG: inositol monophosphatase [Patescibacteria group bacterium]